jgi:hypothetical protein
MRHLRLCLQTSGADFLGDEAVGQNRNEDDFDKGDQMHFGQFKDGIQLVVATDRSQRAFNDPPNPLRNEGSAVTDRDGLNSDNEHLANFGQPLSR